MPKKTTRREMNILKKISQRNQKLKNGAPVKGKIATNEEKNRAVISDLLKKAAK